VFSVLTMAAGTKNSKHTENLQQGGTARTSKRHTTNYYKLPRGRGFIGGKNMGITVFYKDNLIQPNDLVDLLKTTIDFSNSQGWRNSIEESINYRRIIQG